MCCSARAVDIFHDGNKWGGELGFKRVNFKHEDQVSELATLNLSFLVSNSRNNVQWKMGSLLKNYQNRTVDSLKVAVVFLKIIKTGS